MSNNITIIAAHPDDEVLGCAGTIARHAALGDKVNIVFMTNGVGSRSKEASDKEVNIRRQAAVNVAQLLGAKTPVFLDFPDNRMDSVDLLTITQSIENILQQELPDIIYTHFPGDLNIDHCITHQAVLTACRPQIYNSVKAIYCFEILSSTEWNSTAAKIFVPNVFINITEYWHKKVKALEYYADEMRYSPHSRSLKCIDALAVLRGETNGFKYAEAFMLERILVD